MSTQHGDGQGEPVVLIVDDEQEILDSLRRTLRSEPYRVETTTSPLDALDRVERGGIDLLISDIDMPELSGIELVERVRRSRPEVVRLLLTGDASLESALAAINSGEVLRYLTKPWNKDELRSTLREALERLEELRRAALASRSATLRQQLLSELEREHPGVCNVDLDEGVYVLDGQRIASLIASIGAEALQAFLGWSATELASATDQPSTVEARRGRIGTTTR